MPDFPPSGGASALDVWTYVTRDLNSDANNTIRDAIVNDATRFPGGNIDAAISTRATQASILTDATPFSGARIGKIPAFEPVTEATVGPLTGPGTEDILVEFNDGKTSLVDGYVDLTPMIGGDTSVIRQYMKVKAAGAYVKYAEETYTGVQAIKLLYLTSKTLSRAVKVTAEQTAKGGANFDTLDTQFFRRLEA
jgi:hypothetical protein